MATDRLFLYDKYTNSAACIAKGGPSGWYSTGTTDNNGVNRFLDHMQERPAGYLKTKLSLKTESDLPEDCKCFWDE